MVKGALAGHSAPFDYAPFDYAPFDYAQGVILGLLIGIDFQCG